jgi:nitroreductase
MKRAVNLAKLVQQAMLAPSSHNTQPWRFRVADDTIYLYADRSRALPMNDPDDRELTMSCGCALLNLRVAAAAAGLQAALEILPDGSEPDLLAAVQLRQSAERHQPEAELSALTGSRHTYRRSFDKTHVDDEIVAELCAAARTEGAWLRRLVGEQVNEAAALVARGGAAQWADRRWREELAQWMRPRRSGDGLTLPGVVAPLARMVVRNIDMGKAVAARDRRLAQESPVLAILGTAGDTRRDWLAAGQALERVLLTARRWGLQASFLNQPVQVSALRSRLQQLAATTGFPQMLIRLGVPSEEPGATPRRVLSRLMV